MAYVSLYRKYRPQTFEEIVGQQHVTTTLAQAVSSDRSHHAYLFTGPRGTGKTTMARLLAKALNCESGPTAKPCNACAQCEAITTGAHVDVIEIDAASHGGVDDVRDLRDRVAFAPAIARRKVYIVDECHMLSSAGWNAFLKTVEEPPGHVVFVFATTEPHKVLDTILSRTQRFDFKRIPAEVLAGRLADLGRREGLEFEPGAIDLIARAGDGSARDAESVLDQVIAFAGTKVGVQDVADVLGAVGDELLTSTADLIAAGDVAGICELVGRAADAGHDLRQFAKDAVDHLRELFLVQVAPESGLIDATPERSARLRAQAERLGRVELLRAIELLGEAQAQMRRGNTRLPVEIALIKAAMPEASGDPAALAARLDRLERRSGVEPSPDGPSPDGDEGSAVTVARSGIEVALGEADRAEVGGAGKPQAQVAAKDLEEDPDGDAIPDETTVDNDDTGDPQPDGPTVDFALLQRSWPAVLDAVKTRSRRLEAFLSPAHPARMAGSELTLEFAHGFHAEQCGSEEWRPAIESVLHEVLGARLRIRCEVADRPATTQQPAERDLLVEEAGAVAEAEAAAAAGDLPDTDAAHEQAIRTLRENLGATVVEDERHT